MREFGTEPKNEFKIFTIPPTPILLAKLRIRTLMLKEF
jgi:hypothetical protein